MAENQYSSRPAKRRCTSDELNESSTTQIADMNTPVRSSKFWFDDGTVILQAENTQFRVHRTFLGANSAVFTDMFRMPQPGTEDVLVEGCPIIHVHDAKGDWKNLLTMMYYPAKIMASREDLSVEHLISMLRLGKKYEFDAIYASALARLKEELPQTLQAYDAIYNPPHIGDHIHDRNSLPRSMARKIWSLFDLTNVAIELDIRSVLPVAYYRCAMIDPSELVQKPRLRKDGTTTTLSPTTEQDIFLGREKLRCAIMGYTLGFLFVGPAFPQQDCATVDSGGCQKACLALARGIALELAFDLNIAFRAWDIDNGLCDFCQEDAKKRHDAGRKKLWKYLPRVFSLESWEKLNASELSL